MNDLADRIARRFVTRIWLGQMRDPLYWLWRISKRVGMEHDEGFLAIKERIDYYNDRVLAYKADVQKAMAERPPVLQ